MKILLILEHYYPHVGGLETLFKSLAETLAQHGHTVTVITTLHEKSLLRNENLNGVIIHRFPFKNRYLFTLLGIIPALKNASSHDIIQTTSYNAGLPAYFAGLLTKTPVVITFHEVWDKIWFELPYLKKWQRILFSKFEKMLLRLSFDRFIAVSDYTAAALKAADIPADKVSRIYNGIEYMNLKRSVAPRNKPAVFDLVYFGRLGVSKGIDILLKSILPFKGLKYFKLTIISNKYPNSLYIELSKFITQNGLDNLIDWIPSMPFDELQARIRHASAVVIPSYTEGFCFVAAETIALGTPIIHSNMGALKEVVGGKFLIYDHPNPTSLSNAIQKAMQNQWKVKPIQYFQLEDTVRSYEELYQEFVF